MDTSNFGKTAAQPTPSLDLGASVHALKQNNVTQKGVEWKDLTNFDKNKQIRTDGKVQYIHCRAKYTGTEAE